MLGMEKLQFWFLLILRPHQGPMMERVLSLSLNPILDSLSLFFFLSPYCHRNTAPHVIHKTHPGTGWFGIGRVIQATALLHPGSSGAKTQPRKISLIRFLHVFSLDSQQFYFLPESFPKCTKCYSHSTGRENQMKVKVHGLLTA